MPNKKTTLCWDCARATTFECSWVKKFKPVKGWKAEPVHTKDHDGYHVEKCPLFVRDACNGGLRRYTKANVA